MAVFIAMQDENAHKSCLRFRFEYFKIILPTFPIGEGVIYLAALSVSKTRTHCKIWYGNILRTCIAIE